MSKSQYSKKAQETLIGYNRSNESLETNAIDLLSDLMHWCYEYDVPFTDIIIAASGHFNTELKKLAFKD